MRDRCFISLAGAIGLTAILPVVLPAQSLAWRIDPLRSSAQFSVRHMMI
jgi:hypothetical protein